MPKYPLARWVSTEHPCVSVEILIRQGAQSTTKLGRNILLQIYTRFFSVSGPISIYDFDKSLFTFLSCFILFTFGEWGGGEGQILPQNFICQTFH